MFILFYFLAIIKYLLWFYSIIFFIYILMSWLPIGRDNFVSRFLGALCEPPIAWVREHLPPLQLGMFNFSVFYIYLALIIADRLLGLFMGMIAI